MSRTSLTDSSTLANLDEFDFHRTLHGLPGLALVLFSSAGCGTCRRVERLLPEAAGHGIRLFKVDVLKSTGLARQYEVLEIDNKRFFKYQNLYFDTDDFFFYHQHHNRNLSRYKVRFRRYVDTNQCYFEVKHKNNKRKTLKSRLN